MGVVLPEQIKLACQRYTASRSFVEVTITQQSVDLFDVMFCSRFGWQVTAKFGKSESFTVGNAWQANVKLLSRFGVIQGRIGRVAKYRVRTSWLLSDY